MENKFYQNDDFEQFLQDEVKQHRMYPSDNIWKNIRMELHGYKAWPALTFISLFIITALTISTLLINHPDKHLQHIDSNAVATGIVTAHQDNPTTSAIATEEKNDYFQQIVPEQITAETFAAFTETDREEPFVSNTARNYLAAPIRTEQAVNRIVNTTDKFITKELPETPPQEIHNIIAGSALEKEENILYAVNTESTESTKESAAKPDIHLTADDYLKDFSPVVSVTPAKRKSSKFGFEFYITPSTSYRKLSDEKVKEVIQPAVAAQSLPNAPLSPNYSVDINDIVRHKPAMGLEVGFALLYNISDRLKFKTGAQLNIRQYYIETYQSFTNDLGSLSLINNRGIETISFYSPYNNNTGYKQTQLDNKLYQVSVPLGIQWDLIRGKHLGINTEASVQPTMTLNNSTFLLATDYKHYADGNDFIRKWNINTSVGLNITYKTGVGTWQLGPQVRYQHLPTYSNAYPIKEDLLDYGVRLGFTKQIK